MTTTSRSAHHLKSTHHLKPAHHLKVCSPPQGLLTTTRPAHHLKPAPPRGLLTNLKGFSPPQDLLTTSSGDKVVSCFIRLMRGYSLFNCHVSFQSFYNQEVVLYNFLTDVSCLLEVVIKVVINSPLRVVSKVEVVINSVCCRQLEASRQNKIQQTSSTQHFE